MFKTIRISYKQTYRALQNLQQITNRRNFVATPRFSNFNKMNEESKIKLKKCLIISKLSRLEYEKQVYLDYTDDEFERALRNRGSDYDTMMQFYIDIKTYEDRVVNEFKSLGIETKVANRFNCTKELIDWADIIVPVGGDGTFLLAASKVNNNQKPVVGFNSDPNRSEGYLCLPKKYSSNIREAVEKLLQGQYTWLLRSRIRTTLIGKNINLSPKDLHNKNDADTVIMNKEEKFTIPTLALNEVFIGEKLSARVSTLAMKIDNSDITTRLKCSGLCVSTGTGSTSWHLSINRIPAQSVTELLKSLELSDFHVSDDVARQIADKYNQRLIFNPESKQLSYTVRDLISAGVWPDPKGLQPRGFVNKLRISSRCLDAGLVIDGGLLYTFNDGAEALLEIFPEDALRTVVLKE